EGKVSGFVSITWAGAAAIEDRLAGLEEAVRPLALVIERAGLLADIESHRQRLEVTADILSSLATAADTADACQFIAQRLSSFFDADHVVLGTLDFERGNRQVLGFCSTAMEEADLPRPLSPGDDEAYARAISGPPQVFHDLA